MDNNTHLSFFLNCIITYSGGELGPLSAYPNPTTGAILVAKDGSILGRGHSDYSKTSVQAVFEDAGLDVSPLKEWCVSWPTSERLRKDLRKATLYLTLEPTDVRKGQALPPVTQLIELSGVRRVVIGSPDPTPERSTKGASTLHSAGIDVTMGSVLSEECKSLIPLYSERMNEKLQRMARKHYNQFQKPFGFLHCSVVDSDNIEAFARHGNAFGKNFDGNNLSFREFGAYEIAPPPEVVWADDQTNDDIDYNDEDIDDIFNLDFEEEDYQEGLHQSPSNKWYHQVDAVVATFPRPGNGPVDDDSVTARLNGLKWLATYGTNLPAGVERIVVMDATDLVDLPLTNDHPNLPKGVDVEAFWAGINRKPTRVLLRRGRSAQAQAAAKAAAE
jgi:pyrimidine deaminase RibD-like protein